MNFYLIPEEHIWNWFVEIRLFVWYYYRVSLLLINTHACRCCVVQTQAHLVGFCLGSGLRWWRFLKNMKCVNFKLYIFKWDAVLCVPICEIHVMRMGYLISEFYYGLCDIVIVLTLYWCGYVLQKCYLRGKKLYDFNINDKKYYVFYLDYLTNFLLHKR